MKRRILLSLIVLLTFCNNYLIAQCAMTVCDDMAFPGNTPLTSCISCDLEMIDGMMGETGQTGTTPAPAVFCGSVENNIWLPFAAPTTSVTFELTASNCVGTPMGSGIQAEIYESLSNTCTGADFTSVSNCWSSGAAGTGTVTANNLTPGSVYYLMIDGWAGDVCDFSINVTNPTTFGDPPPLPAPTDIIANGLLCFPQPPGSSVNFSIPAQNGVNSYSWTVDGPAILTSDPTQDNIDVIVLSPGDVTVCVSSASVCSESPEYCEVFTVVDVPPAFETVEYCLGQAAMCGDQTIQFPVPGPTSVVMTSYLGCDSVINCIMIPVPPITTEADPVTLCGPASYSHCNETHTSSGIYFDVCQNYQGCDSTDILDLAILEPIAVVAPPLELGCDATNSTVELNAVGSNFALVPDGNTIFSWTGPSFCGSQSDIVTCVDQPGTYCLTLTHERHGVFCDDIVCVEVLQNIETPFPPLVNGPTDPCDGDMSIYTVSSGGGPNPTGYTWTTPNNEPIMPIDMTTIQVDWTGSVGGQLCVTADNDCGPSDPTCIDIIVGANPDDPIIDGPTMVCPADNPTFSVTNPDFDGTYAWTAPAGAFINGSGPTVTIDFSGAVAGDVCVTFTNDCGPSNNVCQAVTLLSVPATPSLMSGELIVCSGTMEQYCVNDNGDATDWSWTTPVGDFPGFGNCIDVDWTNSSGGEICVTANNDCGASQPFCFNVTVDEAPTANITGSGAICQGSNETVDLTINLTGSGPWDLVYNDGTSDVNLNITATPHTLTVSNPGTYTLISLSDQTDCAGIVGGSAVVEDNAQPTVALSGSGAICQGSGIGVELTITLTGEPDWIVQWTVDGNAQADLNITSSPFTLIINETQAGDIELVNVSDGNGCSNIGDGNVINIPINDAPAVSNIMTTCNATNDGYVVTFEITGGDSDSYSVDPLNGVLDNGVFTSTEIASGDGYNFTVDDVNNCNPVIVADASVLCDCTTAVGTMEQTTINECGDGPIAPTYDNTGEALDGDDAVVYILHEGSGIQIINPIATNTVGTSFTYDSGTMAYGTTYYISAVVGNMDGNGGVDLDDDCLAVAQGTPVIFYEIPTATISDDIAICNGQQGSVTITFTGTGPWNIEYDDGDAGTPTEIVNGISANPFTLNLNPTVTTTYSLIAVSATNVAVTCDGTVDGTATVTVNTDVAVMNEDETCNVTATGYVVTFDIIGGDAASYAVSGTISGVITPGNPAVFTSDEIPTGQGYMFEVMDGNACNTITVEQATVICDCTTEVGAMDATLIENCGDDVLTGLYDNTDEVLDGNDVVVYVLHTGASTSLGTIIQTDDVTPAFGFDSGTMDYGTTYYISTVVGDDNGAGSFDEDDPCLAVAAGTPVVWYEIPSAILSGDASICNGEDTDISISLTGSAPWSLTIINDLGFEEMLTDIGTNPFVYTVNPTATATYSISVMQDANSCEGTLAGSAAIQVNEAPTTSAPSITFNATNTAYTVSFEIMGGDATSYSVTPNLGTISATAPFTFTSDEIPCGNGFNFQVDDANLCGPAVVSQAMVICNCDTEAGTMVEPNLEICGNGPIEATYGGGETLDGNDVFSFILRDAADMVIGTNTDPSFSFNPISMTYGTSYFICAVAGDDSGNGVASANDPCYSIGTVCTEVIFREIPTATIANDGSICEGESFDLAVELTGEGPWSIDYVNNSTMETVTETNIVSSPFTLPVSPAGTAVFTIATVFDANGCEGMGSGLSNVTVTNPPVAGFVEETCNMTNDFYVVTFQITLGDPTSYEVLPAGSGTIDADGIFTSNEIATGDSYQFFVDDGNGCGPNEISGAFTCACDTQVGLFVESEIEVCGDTDAAVFTHNGAILDPDDILVYVLHDGSVSPIGNVFATSTDPSFNFQTGMDLNTTYLITALIGNDDGTGNVDLDDPCSDNINLPVTFHELPTVDITGGETLCGIGTYQIEYALTGNGPFDILYDTGGGPIQLNDIDDGFVWTSFTNASVTVTVLSVTDDNNCTTNVSLEAEIIVSDDADAGFALAYPEFCLAEDATVLLDNLLAGADAGGVWSDADGNPVDPTVATINLPIGEHFFTYLVQNPPCADDMAEVSIIINDGPVANAGPDEVLTCTQEEVMISGNPSPGNISYEWVGPGVVTPNSLETLVTAPGIYTLIVTNTDTGCSNSDEMEVTQEFAVPELFITITGISCFGEDDGIIIIDSVANGVAPYMYSFNGGDFSSNTVYPNLAPGDFTILVVDANGCQQELILGMTEPAELDVTLGDNIEGDESIINLGEGVILTVDANVPFFDLDEVQWVSTDSLGCDTCQTNIVMPESETTYSITVENDGCTDSDELTIFVRKDLDIHIANIFSPNDDGVNDLLTIYGNENIIESVTSFNLFNRWGETVYVLLDHPINDVTTGWDGTHRGDKVDLGVYVWFAEVRFVDGTTKIFKGDVMVIR